MTNPIPSPIPESSPLQESFSLSQLSHELRNPVTLISGYLQLFSSAHPEVQEFPYWKDIVENTELLKELLSALSQYNRSFQLQREPLDFGELTESLLASMAPVFRERKAAICTCFQPGLPLINGDALKLRQVLFNLLDNSMDAMPQGGTITLRLYAQEKLLHAALTDTGEGISPAQAPRIFAPFVTCKKNGTGLGLPIVRRILQAHGGTVDFSSIPGQGTCFHFTLPVFSDGTEERP